MKQTFYSFFYALVVLMAGAVLCGCSNSGDDPVEPVGPKSYTITVQATKGGSAKTRYLSVDGDNLNATWKTSEQVYVKKGDTWCGGSLKPQSEGKTATLSGTITIDGTVSADDELTFQFPRQTVDYTGQDGTLESIAAKYDYSVATAKVDNVSGNVINVKDYSDFANQQAIVKFTLKDAYGYPVNATSLKV